MVELTIAAEVMHVIFHMLVQFNGSFGSSLGCGTRTSRCAPLTK
jgi:hypothetical protein